MPAPAYVAERLGIAVGEPVVHHERLNLLDGSPVTLRSGWMLGAVGERLAAHSHEELHDLVLEIIETVLGCPIETAELKIEAVVADSATAGVLGVSPGAPLVLMERLFRGTDGTPVELSFSRIRADRLVFSTVLRRRAQGSGAWVAASPHTTP
ncbi:hypothetical protein BJF78_01965 [Pseudonocardia sp. CNS-139]|nr:hypothetical protein BJF78_01965 [Pseudonocardia sp. CNS-139]